MLSTLPEPLPLLLNTLPSHANPVVDEGLQFSEDYGLARPTEGLDFSSFERASDSPLMSYVDEHQDEFAPGLQYF